METSEKLDEISVLNKKTEELSYISILVSIASESGIPFHVLMSKLNGASRYKIISSILVDLPAAGFKVINSLPIALKTYDK